MFIEELQNRSYKLNTKGGFYYGTTFNANLDLFCMKPLLVILLRLRDKRQR